MQIFKHIKFFILVLIIPIVFSNCNSEEECLTSIPGHISSTNTPATGVINKTIPIEVVFEGNNSCCEFGFFEDSQQENIVTIKVIAFYKGCLCFDYLPSIKTTYNFKATNPGTYYLKFYRSENTYLTDTIIIH